MFVDLIDTFIKEKRNTFFSHCIVSNLYSLLLIVAIQLMYSSFKIQLSKVYHSIILLIKHHTFMKGRYIIYIFYKNVRER